MKIGFVKEVRENERRFGCVPGVISLYKKKNCEVYVERGGGEGAFYDDVSFKEAEAVVVPRQDILKECDVIVSINPLPDADFTILKGGQVLISLMWARANPEYLKKIAEKGCTGYALELIPRTTVAQKMDVLSSQANLGGYQAVITAAHYYTSVFPMMVTPSGTLKPAKVFIIGAGVAGLQAIGTARRLGAVVEAYDIRPEVKEQIESLGAKFFEIKIEEGFETGGGYVTKISEDVLRKQREALGNKLAECDVVITTALVPGKRAPLIITKEMVEKMKKGSVIVDMAAEMGGNCELTQAGKTIIHNGVVIIGETRLPSFVARSASEMFARNIYEFIVHAFFSGKNPEEDDILKSTLVVDKGKIREDLLKI